MTILRTLNDTVRRLGAFNGALWTASRVVSIATRGRWRIHRYYFVAQPVSGSPTLLAGRSATMVIRPIAADDPLIAQFPRPHDVIANRFRMGAHCFAAERQRIFAGFIWIKERRYPEDEVRCCYELDPAGDAAWDFDVHVEPAFRAGRTFARLWESANGWLRERGYQWSLSRISAFNPDSLAAHRRLGARRIGSAIFLVMGDLQIAVLDRAPFVHAGWQSSQYPTIRLQAPRNG